ncbi:hypothetical protein M8C21_011838 [Ambrosia artemisiifolia]|uniref:Uncharacterized protein n=1 Tax=Ambrosia artemisiifolia TaxID=4212 RepID=A0AAD5CFL1_AMBAR|nr:hypothetical protein M8C21_011838 [Ambrosia artemisiifolia]
MGDCQDHSRLNTNTTCNTRSRTRKQLCPRICILSTDSDVRKDRFCSGGGGKVKEVNQVVECGGEGGEERGGWDFSGYSQTEVTVIDTSVACWKFEKVLYRKKNVWKVGDRKGKGLMSGDRNRKKRKERGNESGGGGGDLPKKKLKKKLKLKLCSSLKYADKEASVSLSKSDQGHEHDQGKVVARNEKKRDNCSQFLQETNRGRSRKTTGAAARMDKVKKRPVSQPSRAGLQEHKYEDGRWNRRVIYHLY